MNRISFISGLILVFALSTAGIANDDNPMDTIIKVEGKVMPVDVIKVTPSYVSFIVPGNSETFRIGRKEVHKIIYKNGRIEEYNPLVLTMISEDSWKAVWLTEDEKDVVDLHKRGEIKAQSPPSSRSPKAAKKSAIIRLQKRAAALKGQVVYITKKQATGGYGEFPGYFIEGVVYGAEPLAEEASKDIL